MHVGVAYQPAEPADVGYGRHGVGVEQAESGQPRGQVRPKASPAALDPATPCATASSASAA